MTDNKPLPIPDPPTPESFSLRQSTWADRHAEELRSSIPDVDNARFDASIAAFKQKFSIDEDQAYKLFISEHFGDILLGRTDRVNRDILLTEYINRELVPCFEHLKAQGFILSPVKVSDIDGLASAGEDKNQHLSVFFHPYMLTKFSKNDRIVLYCHELGHIVNDDYNRAKYFDSFMSSAQKRKQEFRADEFAFQHSGQEPQVVKSTFAKLWQFEKEQIVKGYFGRCEKLLPSQLKNSVQYAVMRDRMTQQLMASSLHDAVIYTQDRIFSKTHPPTPDRYKHLADMELSKTLKEMEKRLDNHRQRLMQDTHRGNER